MASNPTPPTSPEEPARAAFEADVTAKGFPTHRHAGGAYWMPEVESCWQSFQAGAAWQAARADDTAASPQEGAQAGWRLVPVEPTEAMYCAARKELRKGGIENTASMKAGVRAAIAAAPAPQEGGDE